MRRRALLSAIPALLMSPAIVRAEGLMRISMPWLSLDDLYDCAAGLGADLVMQHQGGHAIAYALSPNAPVLNEPTKLVIGAQGEAQHTINLGGARVIGYGRMTVGNRFGSDFTSRYMTDLPQIVRRTVFPNCVGWVWRASAQAR
jgi:hypothetical protein